MKPESKPLRSFSVATTSQDGNLYLVQGDAAFRLGDVETAIWGLSNGKNSIVDIASTLSRDYGIDVKTAMKDVLDFVKQLSDADLLDDE